MEEGALSYRQSPGHPCRRPIQRVMQSFIDVICVEVWEAWWPWPGLDRLVTGASHILIVWHLHRAQFHLCYVRGAFCDKPGGR